jgi:uncharacterized protein (TIGR02444 family)
LATAERAEGPALSDALWGFSLAFYALPGVAAALITLQDRDGFDVNLMLFALWLGISGHGRISCDGLAAADRAIANTRSEIVEPLRALRRRLKNDPDADVQRLRDGVKVLELEAEKLVQHRLARLTGRPGPETSADARRASAHANLALYIGSERSDGPEAAVLQEAVEMLVRDR